MEHQTQIHDAFIAILEKELIPAFGCTEPIAIAYAAAKARDLLGHMPQKAIISCSGNIVKNAMGVTVPATGGLKGIEAAALIGMQAGDASKELEVLSNVTDEDKAAVKLMIEEKIVQVKLSESPYRLHICVEVYYNEEKAVVEIAQAHTQIIRMEKNGEELFRKQVSGSFGTDDDPHYALLSLPAICDFAATVDLKRVEALLKNQIKCNTRISDEGLKGNYGASVGATLIETYGDGFATLAKAMPAAGSDARMGGCELPVVINSGSGNQGMTVSLPVIACAKSVNATEEQLLRALCISNLTSIYQKRDIGKLSAYCGAVSAATGAGAGMAYLMGANVDVISQVIVNTLGNVAGIICDGAKASCAAKIASCVDAAIMSIHMAQKGRGFQEKEGFIKPKLEDTVSGISTIAREGMGITDNVILDVMLT